MSSFRTCPLVKGGAVCGGTGNGVGKGKGEVGWARMEFDYYHSGTEEEFEEYFRFVRQVAIEDFELCEVAQGNLEQ